MIKIYEGERSKSYKNNDKIYKCYNNLDNYVLEEILILTACNHDNIIKLLNIEINSKINLIFPYYEMHLYDYMNKNKLSNEEKENIITQIDNAINYLHINNILHLDIKGQNIMINNGIPYLIDYGSCYILGNKKYIYLDHIRTTLSHRPYEHLKEAEKYLYDFSCDYWSFGMLINEVYFGLPNYKRILCKYSKDFFRKDRFDKFIETMPNKYKILLSLDHDTRLIYRTINRIKFNHRKFLSKIPSENINNGKYIIGKLFNSYVSKKVNKQDIVKILLENNNNIL